MTKPGKYGGLGVREARLANILLLGKLVWQVFNSPYKLWVNILHSTNTWTIIHGSIIQYQWILFHILGSPFTKLSLYYGMVLYRELAWVACLYGMLWWLEEGTLTSLVPTVSIMDIVLDVKGLWGNGLWNFDELNTMLPESLQHRVMAIPIPNSSVACDFIA